MKARNYQNNAKELARLEKKNKKLKQRALNIKNTSEALDIYEESFELEKEFEDLYQKF